MRTRRPRRPARTPRLEALEGRALLTCTFSEAGGILTITGDNRRDAVMIADDGTGGPGNIKVRCGNDAFTSGAAVDRIIVETRGGNDLVRYVLDGDLRAGRVMEVRIDTGVGGDTVGVNLGRNRLEAGSNLAIGVDLGAGADRFEAGFGGALGPEARLGLLVRGGLGEDRIGLRADDVEVADGATLALGADGEAGDDRIAADYRGRLLGTLLLRADGGLGSDNVAADLRLAPASSGRVGTADNPAVVRGGAGDDRLRFAVFTDPTPPATLVTARVIGDAGFDRCSRTINVSGDPSCEVDQILS